MPVHVEIPEARAIAPFGLWLLISRARILRQTLFDQRHQGFTQTLSVASSGCQGVVLPIHRNQLWRCVSHAVVGIRHAVGVRHVGLDVEHRGAIEQINAR